VTELVPGDVVRLTSGAVVPADVRLLSVTGLECNESVLTRESASSAKRVTAVAEGRPSRPAPSGTTPRR
jgi:Mg2+-importing ATPase